MKKLAGLFLAATLTLSMTTVAFAAPSKSTTVTDGKTPEGATVSHEIKPEVAKDAGITVDETTGKVTIADSALEEVKEAIKVAEEAESVEVKVVDVFDVQAPEGFKEGDKVEITLDYEYSDGIQVLHFEDGKWVALETKRGKDGKVVAVFTKFSPTAIATVVATPKKAESVTPVVPGDDTTVTTPAANSTTVAKATPAAAKTDAKADDSAKKASTGAKSVKAGDVNTTVYVALIAAAAAACALAARKKFAK